MRGSIQKKGKTYYAVIAVNGKRKWIKGGTKKDAQRVLIEKLAEVQQGTYKEASKVTFSEFSELWLKSYAETNVKLSTFAAYQDIIKRLLNPAFGSYPIGNITTGHLQAYVAERSKTVKGRTVCNEITVLKEICKHAYRWGYLKSNPAEHLERPKVIKTEIEILNPDEAEKLLSNTDNHYRVAFLTGIITGVRAGELWGLQWDDIDWNSKQIYVKRSLWKNHFLTPKSKYSMRKIDMLEELVHELKSWKLACPVSDYDLVFPSPEGKLSTHSNVVKRYFNPVLRRVGLRKVSFHSLRHTNASMRIQAGQNIKYIQSQLGHASINITMDIYGHLFNDENFNRKQVELLEDSFKSVRNPLEKHAKLQRAISVSH